MNELLFLIHIACIISTTLIALHLGKEALCSFLSVQAILANLFVIKQISFFGWNATASDVYIVGSVFSLNLIQEYYGKELARKAIWISFVLLLFYTVVSQIHLAYTPSTADFSNESYYAILSFMPRITIASLMVYVLVQHFDTFFYGHLKKLTNGNYLLARNLLSITLSQLIDTVLFSILGLYGIVDNIGHIMLVSFSIKLCAMFGLTPFVLLAQKWIKRGNY